MALLFLDGFDKYGGANTNTTSVTALMAGEWTTVNGTIVAPLSAVGQAISITANNSCTKTLATNYGRIIGGFRFSGSLVAAAGITFQDAGTAQCGVSINTTGTISIKTGGYATGTAIATSTGSVAANTTHYLEWDITIGSAGAYNVYLDGVSVLSGTGNTRTTTNNTVSGMLVGCAVGSTSYIIDDFYLFDSTGSTNNAPLLTSPRIETTFPSSDSSVAFAIGASVVGPTLPRATTSSSTGANQFRVRPVTPTRNCTLNSISAFGGTTTSSTINLRPVIYSDTAGAPGSLLSAGSTVTGITSGAVTTMPLTTPQSLTAGVQYWIGHMCDISAASALQVLDTTSLDRTGTSTFSSGAPGTAPATSATNSTVIWGNVSGVGVNSYELTNPPQGAYSYVTATGVGTEDLYGFPFLSTTPQTVHAVALKANVSRSDSGARTVSMRVKSGSTDNGGSATGQTPGTSYGWIGTFFPTDPNTGAAWLPANLNAATSGIQIDS